MNVFILRSFFSATLFIFSFYSFAQCDETTVCTENTCPANETDLENGGTFCGNCTVNIGGTADITGDVCWVSGTLTISGNNGDLDVESSSTFTILGGTVQLTGGNGNGEGDLDLMGSLVVAEGATFTARDEIDVQNGGSLTVSGTVSSIENEVEVDAGATVTVNSTGLLTAASQSSWSGTVDIYGSADIEGGIRIPGGDVTVYSGGDIDSGSELYVGGASGTLDIQDGATVNVPGELSVGRDLNTGTVTLNGTVTAGSVDVANGTSTLEGTTGILATSTFSNSGGGTNEFSSCTGGTCYPDSYVFTCDETTVCSNICPVDEADLADGGVFCGTCTLDVGDDITITDDVCWVNGTLTIEGTDGSNDLFVLNTGATLTVVEGLVEVDDGGAIISGDIVIQDGGEFRQTFQDNVWIDGGNVTVQDGGVFDVQDDLLVYNGAVFTIDFGAVANVRDDLRNSSNGNGGAGTYSQGTVIVNGTLNMIGADADLVIEDTEPDDSSLSGTGVIDHEGDLIDEEEGFFDECASPCNGTTLPVELISFTGSLYEGQQIAHLNWSTGTEINNEGFYVERSLDGVEFDEIGFVEGNGSTSDLQEYTFLDYSIDISSYYRLRQVDYDGQFEFSPLVFVSMVNSYSDDPIKLYPNPAIRDIKLSGLINERYDIQVVDMTGKVILNMTGSDLNDAELAINQALLRVRSGLFLIKFVNPGYAETIRLIKN